MNNTLSKIIMFAAGAAIGSVVTWKLVKTKYEQIALEEIESIRELYAQSEEEGSDDEEGDRREEDESYEPSEEDKAEYDRIVKGANYVAYAASKIPITPQNEVKPREEEKSMNKPYIIRPEEFDENGYQTVTLYCFADGVITDEMENRIEDVKELVVEDVMDHFGEYEEDSVYVRNDERELDIEILRDCRKFSEVE